ncbi:uncharacterized protein LOC114529988 [Dendronephthya gigantea]|uniref:uncharacterized protein LOC114529988 n=1 Tax=Dendronephthya gigantea TaxID=151771 RepID=UPI00106A7C49|nr:uncharacterized protein LOC114529988 [Dendronephthya gigantea]
MPNLQLELDKLKWDTESLVLARLLDKHTLPKIVRVTEGFYGESDDSTLCNGTILCLHSVQSGEMVHGRLNWGKGKDILIPLDCRTKVEIRPTNLKDVYESVEELCSVSPKYVRVSQGCYSEPSGDVLLEVGDKLQLKGVNKKQDTLICFDQHRQKIELPKDTVAGFQPLTDGKEYYLSDVVKKFKMPLNVQFVRCIGEDLRSAIESPCQPYQAVCLDKVSNETVVTATSIRANGKHNLIQFSRDLNVGLSVCEETFTASENFPNLSKIFNKGREETETNAYEYIDPATIMEIRPTKAAKPAPNPPPKRPKPTIPLPKPKTQKKTTVHTEPDPIYEEIRSEDKHSEFQGAGNDSTYTALDPTYVSNQKYGELIVVQKLAPSTNNQPEILAHPKMADGATALLIRLPPSSEVEGPPPLIPRRSQGDLKIKKDHQIECFSVSPDAPHGPKSPHLSLNNLADPHISLQTTGKSVASQEPAVTTEQEKEEIYEAIAKYPLDLSGLNVEAVGKLLVCLQMEKYVEIFKEEMIDGRMLSDMDKESLQSLNVSPFHVKKLLNFIGGWRPKLHVRSSKC